MSAENTTALSGKRILVVEDWFAVAEIVEEMLEEMGCEVLGPHESADAARADVEGATLDGAVLDVQLRDEDSMAIADALVERGVPIVFMTGHAVPAVPERHAGAPCLQKPFNEHMLKRTLRALLDGAA